MKINKENIAILNTHHRIEPKIRKIMFSPGSARCDYIRHGRARISVAEHIVCCPAISKYEAVLAAAVYCSIPPDNELFSPPSKNTSAVISVTNDIECIESADWEVKQAGCILRAIVSCSDGFILFGRSDE